MCIIISLLHRTARTNDKCDIQSKSRYIVHKSGLDRFETIEVLSSGCHIINSSRTNGHLAALLPTGEHARVFVLMSLILDGFRKCGFLISGHPLPPRCFVNCGQSTMIITVIWISVNSCSRRI